MFVCVSELPSPLAPELNVTFHPNESIADDDVDAVVGFFSVGKSVTEGQLEQGLCDSNLEKTTLTLSTIDSMVCCDDDYYDDDNEDDDDDDDASYSEFYRVRQCLESLGQNSCSVAVTGTKCTFLGSYLGSERKCFWMRRECVQVCSSSAVIFFRKSR